MVDAIVEGTLSQPVKFRPREGMPRTPRPVVRELRRNPTKSCLLSNAHMASLLHSHFGFMVVGGRK